MLCRSGMFNKRRETPFSSRPNSLKEVAHCNHPLNTLELAKSILIRVIMNYRKTPLLKTVVIYIYFLVQTLHLQTYRGHQPNLWYCLSLAMQLIWVRYSLILLILAAHKRLKKLPIPSQFLWTRKPSFASMNREICLRNRNARHEEIQAEKSVEHEVLDVDCDTDQSDPSLHIFYAWKWSYHYWAV